MTKKAPKPKARDWKYHEESTELLYSYLKKKGKHKRAEETKKSK
tara:strand:+ start:302 stop:433 length:132 start_codon:yes stop_codon:yes gene_type:complete